jgi:acetyl esterase/lipase
MSNLTKKTSKYLTAIVLGLAALFCICLSLAAVWYFQQGSSPVKIERDIAYGLVDSQPLLLDIFSTPRQPDEPQRAALILVHGGGFAAGNKKDFDFLAKGLAAEGYVTFSINYRLVRDETNKYPAQLDDVQRAVRWIRSRAEEYHLDPSRLCAIGGSAGGHLASMLGTTDTRDNSDAALSAYSSRVTCVVALYAPQDLTVPFGIEAGAEALILNLIGQSREAAPEKFREASPLYHIDQFAVPFLIFHGTLDPIVPVDQAERFHVALQKAGIASELILFEGEGHSIEKPENIQIFIEHTLAFLKKHLGQ